MLTPEERNKAARLIGSSASDCEITLMCQVKNSPFEALSEVARALYWMNEQSIEKLSHRRALVKAGRAALKKLGDM